MLDNIKITTGLIFEGNYPIETEIIITELNENQIVEMQENFGIWVKGEV